MSDLGDLTLPESALLSRHRLFATKLQPPPLMGRAVSRRELIEPLLSTLPAGLVLVTAPAGFGKTTLLGQMHGWLRDAGMPTGWLSLERADDELGRFVAYLHAALAQPLRGGAQGAAQVASSAADSPLSAAMELTELVAASSEPFALFLDDFHEIRHPDILGLLSRLLSVFGPGQRMIVGTRELPSLDIHRLRAYGKAIELDARKLRFSLEETREFLSQAQVQDLEEADVLFLHERTEGWAAAVQLAALALAGGSARPQALLDATLSTEEIADYLAHEVFASQPDDIKDFLVRTSILEGFCAELCDAVTARSDSWDMIRRIENANLFLAPLDGKKQWYRYHQMFREFLRQQLGRRADISVPEHHARAAIWLSANARPSTAVEHALRAQDGALAAGIMNGCAVELLSVGRAATLAQWAGLIPIDQLVLQPELHSSATLALITLHRHDEAARLIEKFMELVANPDDGRTAGILALRVFLAVWADRLDEVQACLAAVAPYERLIDPYRLWTLRNCEAYWALLQNDPVSARRQCVAAKAALQKIGGQASMVYSDAGVAMCDLLQGEVREAVVYLEQALEAWEPYGERFCTSNATIAALLSEAKYLTRSIAASRELLDIFLPLIKEGSIPEMLISSVRVRVRIAVMDGEPELASELLSDLESLGEQRHLPRVAASAWLERSRLALLAGNMGAARRHLEVAAGADFWHKPAFNDTLANDFETPAVALLRIQIKEGTVDALIPDLQRRLAEALATRRLMRALKLRILLAQALWVGQRRDDGLAMFGVALHEAAAERLLQPFADEPWVLTALLRAHAEAPGAHPTEFTAELAKACGVDLTSAPQSQQAPAPAVAGILSRREIEVLALVARGLSNKEIARELFRSETTVATHLRNIYTKLDATGRMQAILLARQHGLLI